jgi:hypothetical protein
VAIMAQISDEILMRLVRRASREAPRHGDAL